MKITLSNKFLEKFSPWKVIKDPPSVDPGVEVQLVIKIPY